MSVPRLHRGRQALALLGHIAVACFDDLAVILAMTTLALIVGVLVYAEGHGLGQSPIVLAIVGTIGFLGLIAAVLRVCRAVSHSRALAKRSFVREQLGKLLFEGSGIKNQGGEEYSIWYTRVEALLTANVGAEQAARFHARHHAEKLHAIEEFIKELDR